MKHRLKHRWMGRFSLAAAGATVFAGSLAAGTGRDLGAASPRANAGRSAAQDVRVQEPPVQLAMVLDSSVRGSAIHKVAESVTAEAPAVQEKPAKVPAVPKPGEEKPVAPGAPATGPRGVRQEAPTIPEPAEPDAAVTALSMEALNSYIAFFPARSTQIGLGRFDAILGDYRKSTVDAFVAGCKKSLSRLGEISAAKLSDQGRVEQTALRVYLRSMIRLLETTASPSRDPNFYIDESIGAVQLLAERGASGPSASVEPLAGRMASIPSFFAVARENLQSCPKTTLRRAIMRLRASAPLFQTMLPKEFQAAPSALSGKKGIEASAGAWKEVAAFADWLEKERLPSAPEAVPLGEAGWQDWMRAREDIPLDPGQLLGAAEADLTRLKDEFRATATRIAADKTPEALLGEISMDQFEPAAARTAAAASIEKLWDWTVHAKPTQIPSETMGMYVRETPAFRRRDAPVRADLPGSYEPPQTAFLEIAAPDPTWSVDLLNGWLSSYAKQFLPLAVAREVYPGRFTAWQRMRESKIRTCKTIVFPTFAEGWPLYAEETAVRMGFGSEEPRLKLAMLVDMIRADARLIASIRLNTMRQPPDAVLVWLVHECFWSPGQAAAELGRIQADPDAAAPALGRLAILALRDDVLKATGTSFSAREFHDRLLSFGSAPVSALRRVFLPGDGGILIGPSK